jgi:hypothetical protein
VLVAWGETVDKCNWGGGEGINLVEIGCCDNCHKELAGGADGYVLNPGFVGEFIDCLDGGFGRGRGWVQSAKSMLDRVRREPKTIVKEAISEILRVCYNGMGGVDIHARTQKLSNYIPRETLLPISSIYH